MPWRRVAANLRVPFAAVLDLAILAALVAQVIWGEEAAAYSTLLGALLLLTALVGSWGSRRDRMALLPPLSLVLACSTAAVLAFCGLVGVDELSYSWLFGEQLVGPRLPHLVALLALVCMLLAVYRKAVLGWRLVAAIVISAAFGVVVLSVLSFPVGSLFQVGVSGGAELAKLAGLVACRALLAERSGQGKVWRWISMIEGVLLISSIMIVLSVVFWGSFIAAQRPLPDVPDYQFKVSKEFLAMLLVSEDPIFARHHGIDFKRQRDAVRELLDKGEYRRGGSTLTMQLAKVRYLSSEKSIARKLKQIGAGIFVEWRYGKERVLWEYINTVPFGPGVSGIWDAAREYYGVEPDKLNRQQSLTLVLSIFDPGSYNPGVREVPSVVRNRGFVISSRAKRFFSRIRTQFSHYDFVAQ